MTTAARCGRCGAAVSDDALFCARCGSDVSGLHGSEATIATPAANADAMRAQSGLRAALRDATLGEYEILAELGRGGMATVFLAHDISLDRKVAIKVMAPHLLEGPGMLERFKLEARTAAQLSHPHIIPIYAVREQANIVYFVMKFIEGRPLDAIIKKMGPMPIPMVKDILTKVGQALGYAHRRDVVHRDVKPGNVMIDEESTPIVTDFGIAKVTQGQALTMTGAAIGTPSYMSPEQCEGGTVTGASDQYSLGVVAWEMLTGRLPFAGDSAVAIMYKHCHEPLPPLADFRPDCPPEVREAVERMLAKNPAERWPSMEAAVQKLGTNATLSFDDPVRTQIIDIVKEGGHRELLAGVKTPRSPLPATRRGGTSQVVVAPAPRRIGARAIAAAVAVVALLSVGAIALLGPNAPQLDGESAGEAAVTPEGAPDPGAPLTGSAGAAESAAQPAEPEPSEPLPAPTSGVARPEPSGNAAVVRSLRVVDVPARLVPGGSARLSALALDAGGASLGPRAARWSSSDARVATVNADGVVTGQAPGQATISATFEGARGSATIVVAEEAVASLVLGPAPAPLQPGQRATLAAQTRGASGAELSGRAIAWRSSNDAVATVSAAGVVTAVAPGSAVVSATSEGVSGSVTITVRAAEVDARAAIVALIERYARALESGDIEQVRRAYPGMTSQQEQQLRQALGAMRDLRADLRVGSVQEQGSTATADVSGTYTFYNAASRREEQAPVTFRATFERAADGSWRLTQTR